MAQPGRGRGRGQGMRQHTPLDNQNLLKFPGALQFDGGNQGMDVETEISRKVRLSMRLEDEEKLPVKLYDVRMHRNFNYTSNVLERKYEILRAAIKQTQDEIKGRAAIRDLLTSLDPKDLTIVIMNISMFLESRGILFVPAEIGLTAFSIERGIIDNYWSLIDPYYIPIGYGYTVSETSKGLGLPSPPYSNRFQQYGQIIEGLEGFLNKHKNPVTNTSIVFCLKDDTHPFNSALDWLYDQIGQEHNIKLGLIGDIVRPLSDIGITRRAERENIEASILFAKYLNHGHFYMVEDFPNDFQKSLPECPPDVIQMTESTSSGYSSHPSNEGPAAALPPRHGRKVEFFRYIPEKASGSEVHSRSRLFHPERGFNTAQEVEDYLESQELSYDPDLSCLYHVQPDNEDYIKYCSLHVTNRYAYGILAALTGHFGISPLRPGFHKYLRGDPFREEKRRLDMLKKWGHTLQDSIEFSYDGNPPPMFSTRMSDDLHPRNSFRPE